MTLLGAILLGSCAVSGDIFHADDCHSDGIWPTVEATVVCDDLDLDFAWTGPTRVGGLRGDAWDGLGFWIGGDTESGGSISVGVRPAGAATRIGFEAIDEEREARFGYVPTSKGAPEAPFVEMSDGDLTCDASGAGSVELRGLPDALGGELAWEFAAGVGGEGDVAAWSPDLPSGCALDPASWKAFSVHARCGGDERIAASFVSPTSYAVALDRFGAPASIQANWTDGLSGTCNGATISVDATLSGSVDVLTLTTTIGGFSRENGEWSVLTSVCGTCDDWTVDVDGLPI